MSFLALSTVLTLAPPLSAADKILWRHEADGSVALWTMNGTQLTFSSLLTNAANGQILRVVDPGWQIVAWADFDGDGERDILWRHTSGINAIWILKGATVTDSPLILSVPDPAWVVVGAADFDGDGKADILWRNSTTGENALWKMSGSTLASNSLIVPVSDQNWQVAGLADFDGDGKADILWRNSANGQNILWLMDGFLIKKAIAVPTVTDTNWKVSEVADIDGDGKADIIWRHKTAGWMAAWLWDGTNVQPGPLLPTVADLNWQVIGARDFNGDGKADLLWRHSVSGENAIWFMDGTSTNGGLIPTVADTHWKIASDQVTRSLPVGTPPPSVAVNIDGNWQLVLDPGNSTPTTVVGNLQLSNGDVSGTLHLADSLCFDPGTAFNPHGVLMGSTLILNGTVGTASLTMGGSIANGGHITSGSYLLRNGCVPEEKGIVTGALVRSLTGVFSGTTTSLSRNVSSTQGSLTITQGTATDGFTPLSGASTLAGDAAAACGLAGTVDASKSFIAGEFFHLEIGELGGVLHVIEGSTDGTVLSGEYQTSGGACNGDAGNVRLSR